MRVAIKSFTLLALFALYAEAANAYELTTHTAITYNAYQRSRLGSDQEVVRRYGLDRYLLDPARALRPFGDMYYDAGTARRTDLPGGGGTPLFERSEMSTRLSGFDPRVHDLTIPGWLLRGAIREDDFTPIPLILSAPNPQDDPYGNVNRPVNHFFDPYLNRPLTVDGVQAGKRAIDWATGAINTFSDPRADTTRRNHFTVFDATEALFRALTLLQRNNDGTFQDLFGGNGTDTVREVEATRYWATTFRSLGDILHLNQDMAQPQHTRNEKHNGIGPWQVESLFTGHASILEFYTDARASGRASFRVDVGLTDKTVSLGTPRPLNFSGYPIPRFAGYVPYFSSGPASTFGKGLADFSNREFFTPAHMFGDGTYPLPSSNGSDYSIMVVDPIGWNGQPINNPLGDAGKISLYTKTVYDYVTNSPVSGSAAFSRSVWDEFLERRSILPTRNLNHFNYDAQTDLLIPRAVAYSAGMLDYFFRGVLEVKPPAAGVYGVVDHATASGSSRTTGGFRKIKAAVRNLTPDPTGQTTNVDPMGTDPITLSKRGNLFAVARFHRNMCYQDDLSGEYGSPGKTVADCRSPVEELVVSNPVDVASPTDLTAALNSSSGVEIEFPFTTPIPISATDLFLQIVYRGPLGADVDAVVVETRDISEPTYAYNYVTWDQFTYAAYPSVDPYNGQNAIKYPEWCLQGYPTQTDCDQAKGLTDKFKFNPEGNTYAGFDPTRIPPSTWQNIVDEPAPPVFVPLVTMTAPTGKLTRVAILMDANPSGTDLVVQEKVDNFNQVGLFQWFVETPIATISQMNPATGTLNPSVTYIAGRGVFLPSAENARLNAKGASLDAYNPQNPTNPNGVPPLVLTASQINF